MSVANSEGLDPGTPGRPASESGLSDLTNDQLRLQLNRSRERYRRLISRRSVKIALGLSSYAKPLLRKRRSSTASPSDPGKTDGPIRRIYEGFDAGLDRGTREELHRRYSDSPHLSDCVASVIMPTYNRAGTLLRAVDSVLGQTHEAFELIIVDDGSTDETEALLSDVQADPRVSYIRVGRGGVSRARNFGIRRVTGTYITYLDSDNYWDPQYLELMLAGMDRDQADVGYSAMRLVQHGREVGFRGDEFDYDECLVDNFVDLNVLCHKTETTITDAFFDESLRRLNDWDFLLRIARERSVSYFPFVGATYSWEESSDQLTLKEPGLYRRVVEYRHSMDSDDRAKLDSTNIFWRLPLKICIRTATPFEERENWGDYYFARGLGQALERLGHQVLILFKEDPEPELQDVVISLRGLVAYKPVPRCVNVLWNISHPDLVDFEEIESFDLSFAASMSWPTAVSWAVNPECHTLLQATDRAEFFPRIGQIDVGGVVFVGNSRAHVRWIVSAAIAADQNLTIFGGGWQGTAAERFVRAEHLSHNELGAVYATSGAVLNDHWASMRDFGFISNRVFDVTASGGALVSDHLPTISEVFGNTVVTVRNPSEVADAAETASSMAPEKRKEVGAWVMENHSFDNRALELLEHIEHFLLSGSRYDDQQNRIGSRCALCDPSVPHPTEGSDLPHVVAGMQRSNLQLRSPDRHVRVGLLTGPEEEPPSDSVYRRLVQPLTTEVDGLSVSIVPVVIDSEETPPIDVLIVPGDASWGGDRVVSRVETVARRGIPVVMDIGDDGDRAAIVAATPNNTAIAAVRSLSAIASEVWVPSEHVVPGLAFEESSKTVTIPTRLDQRLWATYRRRRAETQSPTKQLRIAYTTRGHLRTDVPDLVTSIDAVASGIDLELIVVGEVGSLHQRSWLQQAQPPIDANYPKYVRWLRSVVGAADIGIAVAYDTPGQAGPWRRQVDEYIALGLVPLLVDLRTRNDSVGTDGLLGVRSWSGLGAVVQSFVGDIEFKSTAVDAAKQAETTLWDTAGANATGAAIVPRLIALTDRPGPE